jgi:hypothetical protein
LSSTSPSRRRLEPDPELEAPFVRWPELQTYLEQQFRQGDHVAILGPTGSGKTHIAFDVAAIRGYVIVVACKPDDPLIDDALTHGYYLIPTDQLNKGIEYVDGRPLHPRVIYWPRLGERARRKLPEHAVLAAERAHQRPRIGGALGFVRNEKKWTLMLDEGTWICRDLGLQRDVDSAMTQFRSIEASVIILGQRPSWMGRYVLSQPTHLFLFNTNDRDDRKALGEISGVDTALVRDLVGNLSFDRHEVLYIDTRNRRMYRTIAPPR